MGAMGGARGLVLGGGGITGIAWEIGMIAGLAEQGVDLTQAEVVVGTSAGSVVGAQVLSGTQVEELYARQLADPTGEAGWRMGAGTVMRFLIAAAWPGDGHRGRAYLGRAALAARTAPEAEHRKVFESLLRGGTWPQRRLIITAVDARSGEPMVFDRDSGVELVDAVTASCAVPTVFPPMTINGRRYVDGGVRSLANADLATGCDRVVVIAPATYGLKRQQRIKHQLRRLGADVRSVVVSPDSAARRAIGRNVLDPGRRAPAARAGRMQAKAVVDDVRAVWTG